MKSYLFLVTFDGGCNLNLLVNADNRTEAFTRLITQVSNVRYGAHDIKSIAFLREVNS